MTGPSAGASTAGTKSTALALARSAGGKARKSMAVPTGVSMPPPTPCRMRNVMSCPTLCDRPQSADAAVKANSAKRKVFLVPKRSPTQPDAGIHTASDRRYPSTTHSTVDAVVCRSLTNDGMATLMMVVSMMSMNNPVTKIAATIHL